MPEGKPCNHENVVTIEEAVLQYKYTKMANGKYLLVSDNPKTAHSELTEVRCLDCDGIVEDWTWDNVEV